MVEAPGDPPGLASLTHREPGRPRTQADSPGRWTVTPGIEHPETERARREVNDELSLAFFTRVWPVPTVDHQVRHSLIRVGIA